MFSKNSVLFSFANLYNGILIIQGITSLFLSVNFLIYLMAPIDFTNDKDTIRKVIWGYRYTLKININMKDNTWNIIIFTIITETFAKGLYLSGKECTFWKTKQLLEHWIYREKYTILNAEYF